MEISTISQEHPYGMADPIAVQLVTRSSFAQCHSGIGSELDYLSFKGKVEEVPKEYLQYIPNIPKNPAKPLINNKCLTSFMPKGKYGTFAYHIYPQHSTIVIPIRMKST